MDKNKRSMIIKSRNLWNWLSKDATREKKHYFVYKCIKPIQIPESYCYACEEAMHNTTTLYCRTCFLLKLWGKTNKKKFICTSNENSIYYKWSHSSGEERRRYAKQIADFHNQLLKDE